MTTEEETAPKESIFREKSLEKLTSTDQIDRLMIVVTSKGWIALICLFALIVCAIVWSVLGRLPIEVAGPGIAMTGKGTFNIASPKSGIVTSFPVQPGDWVTSQTRIVSLLDPNLQLDLEIAGAKLSILQKVIEGLQQTAQQPDSKEILSGLLEKEKEALEKELAQHRATAEANPSEELILWNKEATLIGIQLKLASATPSEYLSQLEIEKALAEQNFYALLQQKASLNIYSFETGQILETYYDEGDWVNAGDILAWAKFPLEAGDSHFFYAFLPVSAGQKVVPGMHAEIALENVDPQIYGYIKGEVVEVAEFPSSDRALLRRLRNAQLINYVKQGAPAVMRIVIRPFKDASSPSGYQWTIGKGPPLFVHAGTVSQARITISNRRPISYLLPLLFVEEKKKPTTNPDVYP